MTDEARKKEVEKALEFARMRAEGLSHSFKDLDRAHPSMYERDRTTGTIRLKHGKVKGKAAVKAAKRERQRAMRRAIRKAR